MVENNIEAEINNLSSNSQNDRDINTNNLNQEEIDELFGLTINQKDSSENKGIRAMLDKALQSYERFPMLEIVFDRFVRLLSSTLRNFTAETVDVDISSISSLRFGNYINSVPVPALITVFKAVEWENFGLLTADSNMIYSLVEILLGGRKSPTPGYIEGRSYTTIEQAIVRQLSDLVLADLSSSFHPITPSNFQFDRIETNPRFTTIARPNDSAILLQLRIEMEERGGKVEILFPYATFEPIKELLLQVFLGEKFGKDLEWEEHLYTEVHNILISLDAVLKPKSALLKEIMQLKVGNTIIMDDVPDDDIILQCSGVQMLSGKIGKINNKVAVNINSNLNKKIDED